MRYIKGRLFRDNEYLSFVRQRPCLVTGAIDNVVAHHVRLGQSGGMGIKPSDYRTLPLTSIQHRLLHDQGEKSYWYLRGIDPRKAMLTQLLLYLSLKVTDSDYEESMRAIEDAVWHLESLNRETS